MRPLPDPAALDNVIGHMREEVLTAGFRKLRYRLEPNEVALLVAAGKSNAEVFDQVESHQPVFTRMMIGWRKMRRGKPGRD
jgi:hypothetical protein